MAAPSSQWIACSAARNGRRAWPLNSGVSHQMRVWDIHGEGGELCAFEIPNTLVGRSTVVRLLKRVPGVEITKHPKFFSGNDDDFIHFTYGEEEFSVIEPFGDNSRYLVAPERSEGRSHIPEVREWFKQFRKWAII